MIQKRWIYLAARYNRREEMKRYAVEIEKLGHRVVAQWVDGNEEGKTRQQAAWMDFTDVQRSDTVILVTDPYGSLNMGGGRHFEFGAGYALDKDCWFVGEWETIFQHLPGLCQFDTIEEVYEKLKRDMQDDEASFQDSSLNVA